MLEPLAIIAGAIIGAVIGYIGMIRAAKISKEPTFKDHPLGKSSVRLSLQAFNRLYNTVHTIFTKTTADRFLILGAHNGRETMRFASAYYEQHKDHEEIDKSEVMLSFGAVSKFVNFEFDDHYRNMLKESERSGVIELSTDQMPACDLRDIYEAEKVDHSKIYFLNRIRDYDTKGNDLILYASIAKHGKDPFHTYEKTIIKAYMSNIIDTIKSITIEI